MKKATKKPHQSETRSNELWWHHLTGGTNKGGSQSEQKQQKTMKNLTTELGLSFNLVKRWNRKIWLSKLTQTQIWSSFSRHLLVNQGTEINSSFFKVKNNLKNKESWKPTSTQMRNFNDWFCEVKEKTRWDRAVKNCGSSVLEENAFISGLCNQSEAPRLFGGRWLTSD